MNRWIGEALRGRIWVFIKMYPLNILRFKVPLYGWVFIPRLLHIVTSTKPDTIPCLPSKTITQRPYCSA